MLVRPRNIRGKDADVEMRRQSGIFFRIKVLVKIRTKT